MAEQTNVNNQEVQQDLSEILKVRREKLRALYLDGYQTARKNGEAILALVGQAENARVLAQE